MAEICFCKADGLMSVCQYSFWREQRDCTYAKKAVNGYEHCNHYRPETGHCDNLGAQQQAKDRCK